MNRTGSRIQLTPLDFERGELAKYRQWMQHQIEFMIEHTPHLTDCEVTKVHYDPLYTDGKVIVEMKVKKIDTDI